ncbi:MAG: FAD-dependent oxidoreductase, partial [Candidatus Promineofilum sp.]|nr:FAD-dependent oxidoreductase [Promineifilum sp.]
MSPLGTAAQPLRVAIIGAGPAGFYAAERLFKETELVIEVDLFDRLPTPFGLVRNGVAPDHQKIKSVTAAFDRIAANPRFRFFGHVELGSDVTVDDLKAHYHQILYSTGAQTDRPLGIPGDDLIGSHPATEFVAWYNGHPDYRDCEFDLSQESVAVVGVGNVAVDVARILCRTPEELLKTDIADYALEQLRASRVKEVTILGRRGPAQAAFTAPEAKELGELADCDTFVPADEAELDALSQASLAAADRAELRKVEFIQELARRQPTGKSKRLTLRFLVSPVELLGDENGHVRQMRLVRNVLYATDAGSLRARATDQFETLDAGRVFRSIGY